MHKSGDVASLFKELLHDMDNDVYNFTKDGKCCQCGECCSNILPISEKEAETIRKYIKKNNIKECVHIVPLNNAQHDLTCPFLDTSKKSEKCTIYPVRPKICREFICDSNQRKRNGSSLIGQRVAVDVRETFFGGNESE